MSAAIYAFVPFLQSDSVTLQRLGKKPPTSPVGYADFTLSEVHPAGPTCFRLSLLASGCSSIVDMGLTPCLPVK